MTETTAKPWGRPSKYTPEIANEICDRLAMGESLNSICRDDHMPHRLTVIRWLRDDNFEGFRNQYAIAREDQADYHVDEMNDIADNGTNDWMEVNGKDCVGWRENGEAIRRSQLRIDTRKWIASQMRPKKYGSPAEHTVNVDIEFSRAALAEAFVKAGIAEATAASDQQPRPEGSEEA